MRARRSVRVQLFVFESDGRAHRRSLVLARSESSASDANASEDCRDDHEDEGVLDLHLLAEVDLDAGGGYRLNPLRGAYAADEYGPRDDGEDNRNAEHAADRVSPR